MVKLGRLLVESSDEEPDSEWSRLVVDTSDDDTSPLSLSQNRQQLSQHPTSTGEGLWGFAKTLVASTHPTPPSRCRVSQRSRPTGVHASTQPTPTSHSRVAHRSHPTGVDAMGKRERAPYSLQTAHEHNSTSTSVETIDLTGEDSIGTSIVNNSGDSILTLETKGNTPSADDQVPLLVMFGQVQRYYDNPNGTGSFQYPPHRRYFVTPTHDPPREVVPTRFEKVEWPSRVVHLASQFDPDDVEFPPLCTPRICSCVMVCTPIQCDNAKNGMFCTRDTCAFLATCGNALRDHPGLDLCINSRNGEYAIVANEHIQKGVVLGQYLGKIVPNHRTTSKKRRKTNEIAENASNDTLCEEHNEFILEFKEKSVQGSTVRVDAEHFGSLMRFMNHSCYPNARFHEVGHLNKRTVMCISARKISPGEEVTTHYGRDIWFLCRCQQANCMHRDFQ
jgi:SET domain